MATKKEIRDMSRRAAKQVKMKIKLEKRLSKKVNSFFIGQNKTLKIRLANGQTYNAFESMPELREILFDHYRITAKKFTPLVIEELNASLSSITNGEIEAVDHSNDELTALLLLFINNSANESASQITNTTNKLIGGYAARYTSEEEHGDGDEESNFDEVALSNYVAGKMDGRRQGRTRTIATTETQSAAEGSKSKTAGFLGEALRGGHGNVLTSSNGLIAGVAGILIKVIKTWMTQMDAKVRPAHVMANFQEQEFDDPYIVDGELLMYPGDSDLGAGAENWANCRCVSVTRFSV